MKQFIFLRTLVGNFFIVLNIVVYFLMRLRNFAFSLQHGSHTHTLRTRKFYNPVSNNAYARYFPRNICFPKDPHLHFVSEVASENFREDMTGGSKFSADRAEIDWRRAKVYWNTVTNRAAKKPAAGIPISTPTDDIVPLNDYEYA